MAKANEKYLMTFELWLSINTNRNNKKVPKPLSTEECDSFPESFYNVAVSFSQGDQRFDFDPSCLGNLFIALCYPKDGRNWRIADANRILDLGHDTYELLLLRNQLPPNSKLNEGAIQKLNNPVKIERSTITYKLIEPCVEGQVDYIEDEFKFFSDLKTGIGRVFLKYERLMLLAESQVVQVNAAWYWIWGEKARLFMCESIEKAMEILQGSYERVLLLAESWWYAMMQLNNGFAIFNSHTVDSENKPCSGGKARLFLCESIEQSMKILQGCYANGDSTELQYTLKCIY